MEPKQPKIVQRLLVRTFILLLTVAAVFLGIQYVLDWRKDPDKGSADTNGMIAAIQILDEGQQAVIFDKDGKKILSPDYTAGKYDRDITWLPNGDRLFFTSDRKETAYNLYRWNPASANITQKSTGTLSRFDPSFMPVADPTDKVALDAAGKIALLTQGGFVLEFNIFDQTAQQLLPPPGGVTQGSDEESGSSGQFDAIYQKFGTSFRSARWLHNKDFIAAIMKRDEGEILIVQKLNATTPEEMIPRALMAGDKIDIDIDPKSGAVVGTVLGFQFPDREKIPEQFLKNGKVIKPFQHCIFAFDPTKKAEEANIQIAVSIDPKNAFGPVSVSPDGAQIAVTTGSYDGTTFVPAGLALMPLQNGGMQAGTGVVAGRIYEVSWHPNGGSLIFVKQDGKSRAIYTINKDGSSEKKISDDGNYSMPKYSPQSK